MKPLRHKETIRVSQDTERFHPFEAASAGCAGDGADNVIQTLLSETFKGFHPVFKVVGSCFIHPFSTGRCKTVYSV